MQKFNHEFGGADIAFGDVVGSVRLRSTRQSEDAPARAMSLVMSNVSPCMVEFTGLDFAC